MRPIILTVISSFLSISASASWTNLDTQLVKKCSAALTLQKEDGSNRLNIVVQNVNCTKFSTFTSSGEKQLQLKANSSVNFDLKGVQGNTVTAQVDGEFLVLKSAQAQQEAAQPVDTRSETQKNIDKLTEARLKAERNKRNAEAAAAAAEVGAVVVGEGIKEVSGVER